MELTPGDSLSESKPQDTGPIGILLSSDLICIARITGTARELGYRVLVAGDQELATAMIDQWQPCIVFVDLTAGDLVLPSNLVALRKRAASNTAFLAFGSHVDINTLSAARTAGCDPVMPRSKFSAELPELIRSYFHKHRSNL